MKNAHEDDSDVRECCPEYFFLPEMFINMNQTKFGVTQTGETVHHVLLPEWAKGDPYFFTYTLRQMIESEYASKHIHKWIDYIFGYKQ
jgi:hypothetical protein